MKHTICAYYIPVPTYTENGLLEENAIPRTIWIEDDYKTLSSFVGGLIERISIPIDDEVVLNFWFNESGKVLDLPPSAVVVNNDGEIIDYICGNTIIIASTQDKETFDEFNVSLLADMVEKLINEIVLPIKTVAIGENNVHLAIKMP